MLFIFKCYNTTQKENNEIFSPTNGTEIVYKQQKKRMDGCWCWWSPRQSFETKAFQTIFLLFFKRLQPTRLAIKNKFSYKPSINFQPLRSTFPFQEFLCLVCLFRFCFTSTSWKKCCRGFFYYCRCYTTQRQQHKKRARFNVFHVQNGTWK